MKNIQIAAGSIRGTEHIRTGKNNQDAFFVLQKDDLLIGIVCDGCGSGQHSEVGAKIGAHLVIQSLNNQLQSTGAGELEMMDLSLIFENVRLGVAAQIRTLAEAMGPAQQLSSIVMNYFLFTCVGFFVTRAQCGIFHLGDGICALNGKITRFEPMEGNLPPYLAYNIIDHRMFTFPEEVLHFKIHKILAIQEFESLLVGTDGVEKITQTETRMIPGREEKVGSLNQFLENDSFFKNSDMVRRRLAIINGEQRSGKGGLLSDDTTLIVARKTERTTDFP